MCASLAGLWASSDSPVSTSHLTAGVLGLQTCDLQHPPQKVSSGLWTQVLILAWFHSYFMESFFQLQIIFSYLKKANIIREVTAAVVREVQNPCFIEYLVTSVTCCAPGCGYCCKMHWQSSWCHEYNVLVFIYISSYSTANYFKMESYFTFTTFLPLRCMSNLIYFILPCK